MLAQETELYSEEFKRLEGDAKKSASLIIAGEYGSARFNPPVSVAKRMGREVKMYRCLAVPNKKILIEIVAPHMLDDKYPAMVFLPAYCDIETMPSIWCNELAVKVRRGRYVCRRHEY